jgi:hypothetical protein
MIISPPSSSEWTGVMVEKAQLMPAGSMVGRPRRGAQCCKADHRQAGVARIGLLDGVSGEEAYGVDGTGLQVVRNHRIVSLFCWDEAG